MGIECRRMLCRRGAHHKTGATQLPDWMRTPTIAHHPQPCPRFVMGSPGPDPGSAPPLCSAAAMSFRSRFSDVYRRDCLADDLSGAPPFRDRQAYTAHALPRFGIRAGRRIHVAGDVQIFAAAMPLHLRCPVGPWPYPERRGRVDAAGQNAVGACISGGGAGHRRLLRFAAGRQETRRDDWPEVGVAHPEANCADAIARLSARLHRTPVHSRRCKLLCAARVRRRPAAAGTASLIRRNERLAHSGRSV
jgi:hypothetical protein